MEKKRIPITRLHNYYDEMDFEMETDIAKEYMEFDLNFKVVLFRIDRVNTNYDDVYGESQVNEVRYHTPIEILVSRLAIAAPENQTYNGNGTLRRQDFGNLTFSVLTGILHELNVDIQYGDVVGYAITENGLKYFQVFNDGKINANNEHTVYGYKSYARTITCTPLDSSEFNGV